jgi:hypothetical protein
MLPGVYRKIRGCAWFNVSPLLEPSTLILIPIYGGDTLRIDKSVHILEKPYSYHTPTLNEGEDEASSAIITFKDKQYYLLNMYDLWDLFEYIGYEDEDVI